MCNFKSGIILKNKIVIAEGCDDSHTRLLEDLGIADDYLGASKTFIRAELTPHNGEWWINPSKEPDSWIFRVDQDITPDWYDADKAEVDFRAAACAWWDKHVLVDKKVDTLENGYYRLKRCDVRVLRNTVQVACDSSTVQVMLDSSTVQVACDSSTVQVMRDSSTVQRMYGSSTVQVMRDSSTVQRMYGSSTVQEMYDRSTVQEMYDRSTVQEMYDRSTARDFKQYPVIRLIVHDHTDARFEMGVCKNHP